MTHLRRGVMLALLVTGGTAAQAAETLDMKGTWRPTVGAHLLDGPTRHRESGVRAVPGHSRLERNATTFTFKIDGQDGRAFWGNHGSTKVTETLMGVLSVDGKRFVMVDEDGRFDGTVVDANTLDYCYAHITPTDRAVACGVLVRDH